MAANTTEVKKNAEKLTIPEGWVMRGTLESLEPDNSTEMVIIDR